MLGSIHPFEGTTILSSVKQAKAYFTSLLVSVSWLFSKNEMVSGEIQRFVKLRVYKASSKSSCPIHGTQQWLFLSTLIAECVFFMTKLLSFAKLNRILL